MFSQTAILDTLKFSKISLDNSCFQVFPQNTVFPSLRSYLASIAFNKSVSIHAFLASIVLKEIKTDRNFDINSVVSNVYTELF